MFWKKTLIALMLLSGFTLSGGAVHSWAADVDSASLIDLLKKKNIITEQEATALVKEAKAQKEKETTDMVKAAQSAAIPDALKGFKFSSTIFAEWNNKSVDGGSSSNEFNVNRGYITLTKDINDWLSMNITTDLFTSKDSDDAGNGLELRLKNAYFNIKYFDTNTQFGLIGTPSDAYDGDVWPYRVQGKHLLDDLGLQSSADFGLSNAGYIGGSMDKDYLKYGAKKFAGKWGGWMVGLYNGAGYSNSDANNNKVVSGLVYVRPLPNVDILKGFQLAYTGTFGKSNKTLTTGPNIGDYADWRANIVQASLQHPMFTVMGQYYWGKSGYNTADENDRKAWLVDAFVRVPMLEKARIFGKYYSYDPNTDANSDEQKTSVIGISYDLSKELMPFAAWEHRKYDTQTSSLKDYDKVQIGFQLKF